MLRALLGRLLNRGLAALVTLAMLCGPLAASPRGEALVSAAPAMAQTPPGTDPSSCSITGGSALKPAVLQAPFCGSYGLTDLGSVAGLPPEYGGLTFRAGDPNTILIGGHANLAAGGLYAATVARGAGGHITGFGSATLYAEAAYSDGGIVYHPGDDVLLLARWPVNQLGELKPGSRTTDKIVNLQPLGVASSLAALNVVPPGFPGAGDWKFVTWASGDWYTATRARRYGHL
jgi:hypothetical protein